MESSWGRNVAKLGLGSLGATLAARNRMFPAIVITNAPFDYPGGRLFVVIPGDNQLPYEMYVWTPPVLWPRFPYGIDVLPNLPL